MESSTESFYWYDLETTGIDTQRDRIVQFAGLRTDLNLNPIEEPFVTYVRLAPEILPSIEASLITGITPARTE
ncbi:MAG TPA: exodeoxyribonuclease I, partial [Gammaproteobacteria bacterium]|nr:exonuclease domain-containing protein [Pseudomonadota bacterium]HBP15465.1 exodeoxyribonuclease I [Gammaproteobacteria bacterium]